MTAANTGPEKHCSFEDYCRHFSYAHHGHNPCKKENCEHDTRQRKVPEEERMFPVTAKELDQIKNDCLYPERPSCEGCECAKGVDTTRASGLGCTFRGANILMDEVLSRHPLSCNIMTCLGATDMCMERNEAQGQQSNLLVIVEELYEKYNHLPWSAISEDSDFIHKIAKDMWDKIEDIRQSVEAQPQDAAAGKAELRQVSVPSICDKCTSGTGPFCKGCHTLHQLPQYAAPWPELRMIEALEHVASTGSMDAMNAYIAECRKQAEERVKGVRE